MKIVLQKFIAEHTRFSRRQAEELIRESAGNTRYAPVTVNCQPAELGMKVGEDDAVIVNGERVGGQVEKFYLILNKPVDYVCSSRRFKGEQNIFDLLEEAGAPPSEKVELKIAGRLDKNSRGLVLLTNDGDLVYRLTHPRYGHEKEYVVEAEIGKRKAEDILAAFARGVDIGEDDGVVRAKKAEYLGEGRFRIVLTQGKKRQIRRMFGVFDLAVTDLLRTRIGNLKLGDLPTGKWRYLNKSEIMILKE